MKKSAFPLCIVLLAASAMAQVDIAASFKGNRFGTSLEEFKRANAGPKVWVNTGDPKKRLNKKLSVEVSTPLCTDTMDGFEGSNPRQPGEVVCNLSPGSINPQARFLGDAAMLSILYRFNQGRFYKADVSFPTIRYLAVRNSFVAKYGEPTDRSTGTCQNAFGARWESETLGWKHGNIRAVLVEGCGNGPGQNAFDDVSSGSVIDESNPIAPAPVNRAAEF